MVSRKWHGEAVVNLGNTDRLADSSWAEVKLRGYKEIYEKYLVGPCDEAFGRIGCPMHRCGTSALGAT